MAKLLCICGNILSDVCGYDAEAFSENSIELIEGTQEYAFIPGDGRSILECEKCGALAIEHPFETCFVQFYLPENGKYNDLFRNEEK